MDLIPSVKLRTHRQTANNGSVSDKYIEQRTKVMEYYKYQCQACGFKSVPSSNSEPGSYESSGYLEAHHIDDDHENNSFENLVPLCPFCHMVFNVGFSGHNNWFTLIYLPLIEQNDLNLLCNALGVAIIRGNNVGFDAEKLYETLRKFNETAVSILGEHAKSPHMLGTALYQLWRKDKSLYRDRNEGLSGIRMLPNLIKFNDAINYWSTFCWMPGDNWEENWDYLFESFLKRLSVAQQG